MNEEEYIHSIYLTEDISVEHRRKLENRGCAFWLQVRFTRFDPLWCIDLPPGTRIHRGEPYGKGQKSRTTNNTILLPSGLAFSWFVNTHEDGRVWYGYAMPTAPYSEEERRFIC